MQIDAPSQGNETETLTNVNNVVQENLGEDELRPQLTKPNQIRSRFGSKSLNRRTMIE